MREVIREIDGGSTRKINNTSDDGIYYPKITITCAQNYTGNIEIINQTENKSMLLKMKDIPVVSDKKILKVNTDRLMMTDGNDNLVPLYKVGWEMNLDENQSMPSTPMYWFRLMPDINYVKVNGTGKVAFKLSFPRKAGQLDERISCNN